MKTLIKWNPTTVVSFLIICILSILLTGHTISEEKSKLGKTVYSAGNAMTYDEKMDATFSTPKDWNRFFQDTKNGLSKYLKEYQIELLATSKEWDEYIEVYVHDAGPDMPKSLENASEHELAAFEEKALEILNNPSDTNYSVSADKKQEYFSGNNALFLKSVYQREIRKDKEYDMVFDYMTIKDGYILEFCGYRVADTPEKAVTGNKTFEKRMNALANGLAFGDTTTQYRNAKGNSKWEIVKSFTFSIWILILPLLYILLCGMKVSSSDYYPDDMTYAVLKKKGFSDSEIYSAWQKDPLGLSQSKSILGFFAVIIVLHHLVQTIGVENASIFSFLEDFGVCLVGAFFFFSGYGLIRSLREKSGYLNGFLKKRLPGILIPFYVCTLIFFITGIITHKNYGLWESIGYLTGWILLNTHMWYIVEIALFYIVFYLIYKHVKKKSSAIFFMAIFLVLFTAGSLSLCHGKYWFQGEWWYNSSLLFLVGIIMGEWKEPILSAIKKHYKVVVGISIPGFILFYRITMYMLRHHGYWTENAVSKGYPDKWMTFAPQLCMTFFFICCLVCILLKCRFENPVLSFLGKVSLELYLIHNLLIQNCDWIVGTGLYVIVVLIGSLILAGLLHALDTRILCLIFKKPFPKKTRNVEELYQKCISQINRIKRSLTYARKHPHKIFVLTFRTVVCLVIAGISIFPIYVIFINSTRTSKSLVSGLSLIPEGQFMSNLEGVLSYVNSLNCTLFEAEFYSFIIAAGSCLLAVYFGSMCAYGFERFRFSGRKWLWRIVLAAMMFSQIASSVGFYMLVLKLHLLNSFLPLIIPAAATPSVVFFMRMYLRIIPLESIVEAARIDGCRELGIFHRIILPLVKPALCLQIIFTFVTFWNNSFMHSLVLHDPKLKTIAMFLSVFTGSKGASGNPGIYVLLLLATLPPLIVYILFAKNIMGRIVLGAVKE